jgi:transglutaminase-like putative cysteine protease
MAEISLEALYRPAPSRPISRHEGPSPLSFLLSWEAWLTFVLIGLVQLPVVSSLESAEWVDEMPSLVTASLIGATSGWLLANLPWRVAGLHLVGLGIGIAIVLGEVLHTMRLADPLAGTGPRARWDEMWLRLRDWGSALVEGGISADPLPFVLLLVLLVWAIAYVASWAVVRWHNPWAALIPGGFVLLTNISYLPGQPSFSFIIYLFAAILLTSRLQFLNAFRRWSRERISTPDFMSLEVLFVASWVGVLLVVFAWTVPTANNWGPIADRWVALMQPVDDRLERLGRLFVGVGSKKDLPAHAFGDVFPLQGRITLDGEVLMEVVAEEPGRLRGAVYDEYTGAGWRVSSASAVDLPGTSVEAAEFGTPQTRAQVRLPVRAEVRVVGDVPDRRLLAPGEPLATDADAQALVGASFEDVIALVPQERLRRGDTYITVGTASAATADTLLSTGRDYPPGVVDRYTQLPPALPAEVAELARRIAGDSTQPYEVARKVEQYLRDNYPFTLQVGDPPPRQDVVAHFLFEQGQGYFDYHSSAMAVMLRSLGIPARVATGFVLDEEDFDSTAKAFMVSERRAWAWPEVYFAGLGWVEFNPTPGRPLVARPNDDSDLLVGRDQLNPSTFDPTLEELLLSELELGNLDPGDGSSRNFGAEGSGAGELVVRLLTILVGIAAAALVFGAAGRLAWEWEFRGLTPPVRRWAKVQRLAAWAGLSSRATRTPLEATTDLGGTVQDRGALAALARSFTRARYGRRQEERDDEARELDDAYRRVRGQLWPVLFSRFTPLRRRKK